MKSKFPLSVIILLILIIFSCKKENNPPIITNQTFEISENSPDGSLIGNIIATDPDGDMLTIEIISSEDMPFDIEPYTGNLFVKNGLMLNYEARSKYIFMVKVTDNNKRSLFNFASITVVIKNIFEIPMDGLVAYYPFNANATDKSENSYDGILFGPVLTSDRKGNAKSAYSFDGTNDYINLSSLVGNGIRSISLWFRLDINIDGNLEKPFPLVTREGDYNNYSEFSLAFVPSGLDWDGIAGKLRFAYFINKANYYYIQSNSTSWQKERWYHVVAIIHPSEGMKMYIDNVRQADTKSYYNATEHCELNTYLGSWATVPDRYFKGRIDDVIFYNRALTEAEVNELFQQ